MDTAIISYRNHAETVCKLSPKDIKALIKYYESRIKDKEAILEKL